MNKKLLLLLVFFLCFQSLYAQRYGTALGLRFGNSESYRTLGLTLQQRVADRLTIESIIQSDFNRNTHFSLLAQKHRPIVSKRFNYYLGGGLSYGIEESFVKNPTNKEIIHTYGNSTMGVDLIAGVELTLAGAVISLDYKPNLNISGRQEFYKGQVGISARTVLVKSKVQKKNQRKRLRARSKSKSKPISGLFNRKI